MVLCEGFCGGIFESFLCFFMLKFSRLRGWVGFGVDSGVGTGSSCVLREVLVEKRVVVGG